ncbi:unnamed protein product [Coregonus sp. 'balchen']|nr:unnamed protein product [Coregonus sp. 'balchen']
MGLLFRRVDDKPSCMVLELISQFILLHICIEGWGNWRWSEAFSVDNVGSLLRTIQYKGRTASLIIKVLQLNAVQKQKSIRLGGSSRQDPYCQWGFDNAIGLGVQGLIIICGRQVMCSYLSQDIDLRVVQHYVNPDGQTVVKEHADCLEAGRKLPSYVLEDSEMTELCVVFSPLFMMRSHLPDPVIIHTEKRSLGLRESQLIQGQGHQEQLLNAENDLMHHLTFQAREEEDASHCAVPISTAVIKQIVNRNQAGLEDSQEHILADFYGLKNNSQPPWPYVSKDTDSNPSLSPDQ